MIDTLGLDFSHFQSPVEFHEIADVCDFVYLKATEGLDYTDPTFADYRERANSCGLRVGAYHFLHPTESGVDQANHFLSVLGDLQEGELAPAVDVESTAGWSADKIEVVENFVATVLARYHEAKIYFSPGWWESTFTGVDWSHYPAILHCDAWIAEYGVPEPRLAEPFSDWQIHQYAEQGTIRGAGIHDVDTDRWNGLMPDAS